VREMNLSEVMAEPRNQPLRMVLNASMRNLVADPTNNFEHLSSRVIDWLDARDPCRAAPRRGRIV
jgi:hypothetical protein